MAKKQKPARTRFTLSLTPATLEAIDTIQQHRGFITASAAVREAIHFMANNILQIRSTYLPPTRSVAEGAEDVK